MSDLRFVDERDASRYALYSGDVLTSIIDYRDDGSTLSMTRAFTVPTFRGRGLAAILVDRAVADLEARGDRRIVPMCWFVAEWFDRHPDRRAILKAGAVDGGSGLH